MNTKIVDLDTLLQTPYINILCYPKPSVKKAKDRIEELASLSVSELIFSGETHIVLYPWYSGASATCSTGAHFLSFGIPTTAAVLILEILQLFHDVQSHKDTPYRYLALIAGWYQCFSEYKLLK